MLTLEERYTPAYAHPEKTPITVTIRGNHVQIDVWVRYNFAAIRPWEIDGVCQADLIEAAIIRYWSGPYRIWLKNPAGSLAIQVTVTIRRRQVNSVPIFVRPLLLMPAHVVSPWFRRFWGIFKTGQWESLGTNWSRRHPGRMVLPPIDHVGIQRFERIAAHEAGHLFGLGDAYGAIYRFYHEAPATRRFMMNTNTRVQPREIKMLLDAHQTGRMQYFPRKWNWSRFRKGFARELERKTMELDRKRLERRQIGRASCRERV